MELCQRSLTHRLRAATIDAKQIGGKSLAVRAWHIYTQLYAILAHSVYFLFPSVSSSVLCLHSREGEESKSVSQHLGFLVKL